MKRLFFILVSFLIMLNSCGVIEAPKEEGYPYSIELNKYEILKDYEGNDILVLDFLWKNNGETSTRYFETFDIEVYQNGVELESTYLILKEGRNEYQQSYKDQGAKIKPEIEIEVSDFYILRDGINNIEIIVYPVKWVTKDALYHKTITIN